MLVKITLYILPNKCVQLIITPYNCIDSHIDIHTQTHLQEREKEGKGGGRLIESEAMFISALSLANIKELHVSETVEQPKCTKHIMYMHMLKNLKHSSFTYRAPSELVGFIEVRLLLALEVSLTDQECTIGYASTSHFIPVSKA